MSERKKILIFGGGSKFGLELSKEFFKLNHDVSIITSSNITNYDVRIYNVDWLHLDIPSVEKLCKNLDNFDILIFNQNYSKINELENISIEKLYMWGKLKKWQQNMDFQSKTENIFSILPPCFLNKKKLKIMLLVF